MTEPTSSPLWGPTQRHAASAGVDPDTLWRIAGVESGYGNNNQAATSSAHGPWQITAGTWNAIARANPSLNLTNRNDVEQNAAAAAANLRANAQVLRSALGRDPTAGEQYVTWFAGAGTGPRIAKADPSTPVEQLFSPAALEANKAVFAQNRTAGALMSWAAAKMHDTAYVPRTGAALVQTADPLNTPTATAWDTVRPSAPFTETQEAAMETARYQSQWSGAHAAWEAAKNESMLKWGLETAMVPTPDPDYLPKVETLKTDPRLQGIDVSHYGYLLGSRSEAEMGQRIDSLKSDMDYEQKMGELGIGGAALRMAASALDPAGWLVSAASPISALGLRYGRIGRILAAGAEGAVGGVLADVPQMMAKPTYDRDQLMYSAAGGLAFGLGLGGIMKPHPAIKEDVDGIVKSAASVTRDIDAAYAPGARSVGAARNSAYVEPVRADTTDFTDKGFMDRELGNAAFAKARLDIAGTMKRSENPLTAALGGRLVEDAVGNADHSVVNRAVSVEAGLMHQRQTTFAMREYRGAWIDYAERNGIRQGDGAAQKAFREEAADLIDNPDPTVHANADPAVVKWANAQRQGYASYHELAQNPGILDGSVMAPLRGMAEVDANPNYFPRIFDFMEFGEHARRFGDDGMKRLIAESLMSRAPGLEAEDAGRIAKGYYKGLRNAQAGQEVSLSRMLSGDDQDGLMGFLRDNTDLGERDLSRIVAQLQPESDTGNIARTKARLDLNPHHEVVLRDHATGRDVPVKIKDFTDRDSLGVFDTYSRQMSAQVALARLRVENPRWRPEDGEDVARYLVDGIRGDTDWDRVTKQVRAVGDELGHHPDKTEADLKRLQFTFDSLTGRRGATERGAMGTFVRILKDYNFVRMMNQVGFAQAAETWVGVANVGLKAALSQMPTFRAVMRDAKTGKLNDDVMEQLEHMASPGTEMLRGYAHLPVDDFGNTVRDSKAEALEGLLKRGTRLTSIVSGMAPITTYQQKWMAKAALARFTMDATGEKTLNMRRMAVLGIDHDMREKIRDQLRHIDGFTEGTSGSQLKVLQLDKWAPDARHALEYALHTWVRKMVQENDLGQMNTVLGSTMGKLFFQFRSFMFGAYAKNTLHNLHMRDYESVSMLLGTSFFGGLTYAAQTYAQSIGRGDQQQFLARRLDTKSMAAAAIQRGAWSSILPAAADIGAGMLGIDPVFDSRVSGTPSQGLTSFPALNLYDSIATASRGTMRSLATDEAFSQKDVRAMFGALPFGNMLPMVWAANGLMADLPEWDTHKR